MCCIKTFSSYIIIYYFVRSKQRLLEELDDKKKHILTDTIIFAKSELWLRNYIPNNILNAKNTDHFNLSFCRINIMIQISVYIIFSVTTLKL